MIITCENCRTRFRVDENKLGATGRMVRCASCAHVWHQEPAAVTQSSISKAEDSAISQSEILQQVAEERRTYQETTEELPHASAQEDELQQAIKAALEEDVDDEGTDDDLGSENRLSDIIARPKSSEEKTNPEEDAVETSFERRSRLRDQLRARDDTKDEIEAKDAHLNLPMVVEGNNRRTWLMLGWGMLVLTVLVGLSVLYIWRYEVAARYDRAWTVYEALGLLDENVASTSNAPRAAEVDPLTYLAVRIEQREAQVVDGKLVADIPVHITNNGPSEVVIPLMYGVLCDALAQELVNWQFRAPATRVQPGKSLIATTSVEEIPAGTVSMRILFEREYRRLKDMGAVCEGQ
ncbi:MAG: zinc-ribbon domain-containing protein [Sphingomonadales bacterium]|jgi:predicted Zn finger-like uncharacterized protein